MSQNTWRLTCRNFLLGILSISFSGELMADTSLVDHDMPASSASPLLTDVLDQEYDVPSNSAGFIGFGTTSHLERAQTFTVGISGHLSRVELSMARGVNELVLSPLLFDIRTVSNDIPSEPNAGANILGSLSIPAASIPTTFGFYEIDVSSLGISVHAGDVLAIVLRTDDPANDAYIWNSTQRGMYGGGSAYRRFGSGWATEDLFQDNLFRTYVQIPEPSSLALLSAIAFSLLIMRSHC